MKINPFGIHLIAVLMFFLGTAEVSATFIPLGDLPGGQFVSSGGDVSANGLVAVGQSSSAAGSEAFRWTQQTGMIGLGFPEGSPTGFSSGLGASADGSVVVGQGFSPGVGTVAFRWTQTGMVSLGDLPGATVLSSARAVSADGSVVVGSGSVGSGSDEAFRWTPTTGLVGLGFLPGDNSSEGDDVSVDGAVVVGASQSSLGNQAYRWTSTSGMIGLGFLPGGSSSEAFAVSANGSVVVGESSSIPGRQAFGWSQETGMVGLGGFDSRAFDVSSNGAVIVGSDGISSQSPQAFIWDSIHGMRNLQNVLMGQGDDLTGWRLEFARGISADGLTVVGDGINPNGQTEAWLARLSPQQVPETPTVILFAIGIGIMSYHLRSNRRVTKTQVQSFGDR